MNILVADDHKLIIDGLINLLQTNGSDYDVDGVLTEDELFNKLEMKEYDVLFQDIKFGKSDARDFIRKIKGMYPNLAIIILSTLAEAQVVQTLFKQGVNGYLLKSDENEEIFKALKKIAKGEKYVSPDLTYVFVQTEKQIRQNTMILTPRELQVLKHILKGKTTKEISSELFLSVKTIEAHRANLFLKFDVSNIASLVKKAILEGFL